MSYILSTTIAVIVVLTLLALCYMSRIDLPETLYMAGAVALTAGSVYAIDRAFPTDRRLSTAPAPGEARRWIRGGRREAGTFRVAGVKVVVGDPVADGKVADRLRSDMLDAGAPSVIIVDAVEYTAGRAAYQTPCVVLIFVGRVAPPPEGHGHRAAAAFLLLDERGEVWPPDREELRSGAVTVLYTGAAPAELGAAGRPYDPSLAAALWAAPCGLDAAASRQAVAAAVVYEVGESTFTGELPGPRTPNYDDDYEFAVNASDIIVQAALAKGIPFEKNQTAVMSAYVVPGSLVIDIGANVGTVAIPLSRAAGKDVTVFAFEPYPPTWALLWENIRRNRCQNIVPFPVAVGHEVRRATLSDEVFSPPEVTAVDPAAVKLTLADGAAAVHLGAVQLGTGGAEVRMVTIDSVTSSSDRVSLIKVDVEGAEPLALYGARETIRRCLPVISYERNENVVTPEMRSSMALPDAVAEFNIVAFCRSLGYRDLYEIEFGNYMLVPPGRGMTTPNPIHRFVRTKHVSNHSAAELKGYRLHKFQRPRWAKPTAAKRRFPPGGFKERRVYSQNGEDGVLEHIFEVLGPGGRYYVEFGAEDGSERNTRALAERGWTGLLMDGGHADPTINLHREFITAENAQALFAKYGVPAEPDLLSIDIDGNDYYVWEALCRPAAGRPAYRPRVVVIEYNAALPPPRDARIKYSATFAWNGRSIYFGASICALARLGEALGYTLVYAESTGVNLFFVRTDLVPEGAFGPHVGDPRALYRPPTYGPRGRGWEGRLPAGASWVEGP